MRIHLSNVNLNSRSGPNSFAGRLSNQLIKNGHKLVDQNETYDCMLAFIEAKSFCDPRIKLVQRLDGIWFKPEEFERKNREIKKTYESSDHVIFQSNFDKEMVENHWGKSKSSSVIHNGIDLKKVEITNQQIRSLRDSFDKIFVSSASWHRQKRLKENTDLFLKISENDSNSCFVVLGKNPDYVVSHPRIFYTGEIDHNSCLEIYRASDWMIHLAWIDHCPNVVVEALSQGCPVICTNSGGTREIVRENGLIIPEKVEYKFELTDYDSPPSLDFDFNLPDRPDVFSEYLDIEIVAKLYEKALSS